MNFVLNNDFKIRKTFYFIAQQKSAFEIGFFGEQIEPQIRCPLKYFTFKSNIIFILAFFFLFSNFVLKILCF